MAASHITPGTLTIYTSQLVGAARQLNATYQQLDTLKRLMDQMVAGSDYTMLEAQFGLAAGQGVTAYNLVAGALAQIYNAGSGSCTLLMAQLG